MKCKHCDREAEYRLDVPMGTKEPHMECFICEEHKQDFLAMYSYKKLHWPFFIIPKHMWVGA
jgi:hypothetical protein